MDKRLLLFFTIYARIIWLLKLSFKSIPYVWYVERWTNSIIPKDMLSMFTSREIKIYVIHCSWFAYIVIKAEYFSKTNQVYSSDCIS